MPRRKKATKKNVTGEPMVEQATSSAPDETDSAQITTISPTTTAVPSQKTKGTKRKNPDSIPETEGIPTHHPSTSAATEISQATNSDATSADVVNHEVSVPQPKKTKTKNEPVKKSAKKLNKKLDKKLVNEKSPVKTKSRSMKPKRGRGRPRKAPVLRDAESGALLNFTGQTFKTFKTFSGKKSKNKKRDANASSSSVWLSFWKDEEKEQLLNAAALHGVECCAEVFKPFIPSRSVEEIRAFVTLLRSRQAKQLVRSQDFNLGFGMSAADVMKCKAPFGRLPDGDNLVEKTPAHECLKRAFLEAVETVDSLDDVTGETLDDVIEAETLDFDRIYRVIAFSFQPKNNVFLLKKISSEADFSFIKLLLNRLNVMARDVIGDGVDRRGGLVSVLDSRLRFETKMFPFSAEKPTFLFGEVAKALACLPDVNPLRLRPLDLLYSNDRQVAPLDGAEVAPPDGVEVAPPVSVEVAPSDGAEVAPPVAGDLSF